MCEKGCLCLKLHKPAVSFSIDYIPSTLVAEVVPNVEPCQIRKELGQLIPAPQSFPLNSMEDFQLQSKGTIVLCFSQNILYVGKAGGLCENNSNLFSQHLCNALFLNEGTWIIKRNYQFFQVQVIKLGGGNWAKFL